MDGYEEWKENIIHPGEHWLLYADASSHRLVGQIWFADYYGKDGKGCFRWEVRMHDGFSSDGHGYGWGFGQTVEEAKAQAENYIVLYEQVEAVTPKYQMNFLELICRAGRAG